MAEITEHIRHSVGICVNRLKILLSKNQIEVSTNYSKETGYVLVGKLSEKQVKIPFEIRFNFSEAEITPINTDTIESVLQDMLDFRKKIDSGPYDGNSKKQIEAEHKALGDRIFALSNEIKEARQQKREMLGYDKGEPKDENE